MKIHISYRHSHRWLNSEHWKIKTVAGTKKNSQWDSVWVHPLCTNQWYSNSPAMETSGTGFVWKCWLNLPNEIAIFHRDNDQQNHWVKRGTRHFQTPNFIEPPRTKSCSNHLGKKVTKISWKNRRMTRQIVKSTSKLVGNKSTSELLSLSS